MSLSGDQQKAAAQFPEVCWVPKHHVCIFRPDGELNGRVIARLVLWLEAIEVDVLRPFDRFTDLTKLVTLNLTAYDVENLALWRRTNYSGPVVKSVFLAGSGETNRMAEKYQMLMEGSQILVSLFRELEDAARWLRVPEEVLRGPKGGGPTGDIAPPSENGSSDR